MINSINPQTEMYKIINAAMALDKENSELKQKLSIAMAALKKIEKDAIWHEQNSWGVAFMALKEVKEL